jgi:hypothetical protein
MQLTSLETTLIANFIGAPLGLVYQHERLCFVRVGHYITEASDDINRMRPLSLSKKCERSPLL